MKTSHLLDEHQIEALEEFDNLWRLSQSLLGIYDISELDQQLSTSALPLASVEEAISCLRRQLDVLAQLPKYITPNLLVSQVQRAPLMTLYEALRWHANKTGDLTSVDEAARVLEKLLATGEWTDEERHLLLPLSNPKHILHSSHFLAEHHISAREELTSLFMAPPVRDLRNRSLASSETAIPNIHQQLHLLSQLPGDLELFPDVSVSLLRSDALPFLHMALTYRGDEWGDSSSSEEAARVLQHILDTHEVNEEDGPTRGDKVLFSKGMYGEHLINLGEAIFKLFQSNGDMATCADALEHYEEGLRIMPTSHPRAMLRFGHVRGMFIRCGSELDQGIQQKYLDACPDISEEDALWLRVHHGLKLSDALDQNEDVLLLKEKIRGLVELAGWRILAGSMLRAWYLLKAAVCCLILHNIGQGDLSNYVDYAFEALAAAFEADVDARHPNFMVLYFHAFKSLMLHETPYHAHLSVDFLRNALLHSTASSKTRLFYGIEGLSFLDLGADLWGIGEHLLDLYKLTISFLPQVAYLGLDLKSRFRELSNSQYDLLGIKAAVRAISLSHPEQAIELLEEARAVFWSQALKLRNSLDGVPESISKQLTSLFLTLEQCSLNASPTVNTHLPRWRDEKPTELRRASDRAEQLISQVRQIPGLEGFLMIQPCSILAQASKMGPVIVLIANDELREALAFTDPTADTPIRIPLPQLSMEFLKQMSRTVRDDNMRLRRPESADRAGRRRGRNHPSAILKGIWDQIVWPVIDALRLQKRDGRERPRLFWCPTGAFTHLPLHAAGTVGNCTSYYAVSSYIPTISALLQAQKKQRVFSRDAFKSLLVAEANAPGLASIDDVVQEVKSVTTLLSQTSPIVVGDLDMGRLGNGATKQAVIDNLPEASIVHLACHGQQDPTDPLESGFYLRDGKLTVSELMKLNLSRASLAFLSACETAKGSTEQPDQVLHLAATMMFVGFPSVIGTMWSMGDIDGPMVAKVVYEELMKEETVNLDTVPYALDAAVQMLRQSGRPPQQWATFVHFGA